MQDTMLMSIINCARKLVQISRDLSQRQWVMTEGEQTGQRPTGNDRHYHIENIASFSIIQHRQYVFVVQLVNCLCLSQKAGLERS